MTPIGKFPKTAIAVTVAGALVAPATAAFAGEKTERAIRGAVNGGLAGAALGATTAKDRNDRRYSHGYRTAPRYDNRYYNTGYRNDRYAHDRYDRRNDRHYDRYAYGYRR